VFQQDMLKARAIFLSGGGSGLGKAMALRFSALGARMFLVGRREPPLLEVRDEILRSGGSAAFATCDVRDYAAVEAAAQKASEQFGPIDTVVNNAAGNFMARTEKLTPNAFNAVIGIVLNGTFNCTQVFAKKWIAEKRSGNVLAMTTSLAVEWSKYHIRLNAIAPGPFPTEGAWSRLMPSKQFEEHAKESHPMKRFGRHDELTSLAAFLLSDMAEYINGECVVIDGARWLRGAGEFSDLLMLPESAWETMEAARARKS
jgi:NAD(P)-dependent dehydrogenase (short-subunit alcohol dehydrogenase family)